MQTVERPLPQQPNTKVGVNAITVSLQRVVDRSPSLTDPKASWLSVLTREELTKLAVGAEWQRMY